MRPLSLLCTLTLLLSLMAGCASTVENLDKTAATGSAVAYMQPASPVVPAPAVTPSPLLGPEASMLSTVEEWAQMTSTPYRDAHVTTLANLGYFATVEVVAWLRPQGGAAWEVQTADSECWLVAGSWQCNGALAFRPADAETKHQASLLATATAVVAAVVPVAEIAGVPIATIDFQKRVHYEKYAMENELVRLRKLEHQFDSQDPSLLQMIQLQTILDSPFALGSHTLDSMIQDLVIAKEAAARGISVSDEEVDQALHEETANAQGIAELTQELASVFGLSPDEYRAIVRGRLLRQKLSAAIGAEKALGTEDPAQAFGAWLEIQVSADSVKRPRDLVEFLPPDLTDPTRVTRAADGAGTPMPPTTGPLADVPANWIDGTALGDPNAPLEVQIWVDYLCPSCQNFADLVEPQLLENFVKPGKIRLTLHFFPLQQFEPGATLAAMAAACAGEQNRFWPYHWYLMAKTKQDGAAAATFQALTSYASAAALDPRPFELCLAEQKVAGVVAVSAVEAQALNLQFVPSVIVGDTLLQDTTFDGVQAEIKRQLQ